MEEIQIFSFGDFDVPNMLYANRFFLISLSVSKRMRTRERRESVCCISWRFPETSSRCKNLILTWLSESQNSMGFLGVRTLKSKGPRLQWPGANLGARMSSCTWNEESAGVEPLGRMHGHRQNLQWKWLNMWLLQLFDLDYSWEMLC